MALSKDDIRELAQGFISIPESATKTLRRTERRRERATEKKLLAFDVEWYVNHKGEA